MGRVGRQADEQIISQRAPPLGIGPQQILRRKHPGRAVGELGVQLFLAAGQGVQQARRRGVDTHRVGAAVHTVHQRGAQHSQPHALHAGQHQLRDQVGTGGQCGQRHAAAQRLTVQLKQPRLDGQSLSPGRAAFQKRILAAVAAVALHRTHSQNAPVGIPRQWHIAVAPDGYKVECAVLRYRFQQAFTAHQCVLHGGLCDGVQCSQAAPHGLPGVFGQPGLVLGKNGAA